MFYTGSLGGIGCRLVSLRNFRTAIDQEKSIDSFKGQPQ